MGAIRFANPNPQFLDGNGDPYNGGSLTFYESGGTTPTDTYSDEALMTANTNPITLNSVGRSPVEIFLDSDVDYRIILKDAQGTTVWDKDPIGGGDVADAITAHNNDTGAHYAATESQRGFVELATNAEAQTGTDTARAITPANLQSVTATTARKGVIELATTAEAQAGTDATRAITPDTLQDVTATETRKGVVELATTAEAAAGTDTERAVTPAGLTAAINANLSGNASTYTPSSSNLSANIVGVTPQVSMYFQIGDFVFVFGQLTMSITAISDLTHTFELSLPVSSEFTATTDASGTGVLINAQSSGSEQPSVGWTVTSSVANNRAVFTTECEATMTDQIMGFQFGYQVL